MNKTLPLCFLFVIIALLTAPGAGAQGNNTSPDLIPPETRPKDSLPLAALPNPHLYRMNYWVSGGFTAAAIAANVWAIPNLIKAKDPISSGEIQNLNTAALNGFERWALKQDVTKRDQWDKSSDRVLQGTILASAVIGLDKNIRRDALRLFVMYAETHAVTFSLYNFSPFGPAFQNKLRPIVYYNLPEEEINSGNNRNSLYSGHVASATAATFFAAKVYNDYHPEFSFAKKYLIYTAAIPPLVQSYMRVKALKHFPSDILIGFIVGATCGVVVPEMHRFKKQAIRYGVEMNPYGQGAGLTLRWQPGYERRGPRM